ncbi:MAG TPA: hypothetical protein VIG97_07590 [Luteimonas sp.]
MTLRLYAGEHTWLVVPDCMLVSQAALEQHGPLRVLGVVTGRDVPEQDLAEVQAQLDEHFFAEVPAHVVARLLAELDGADGGAAAARAVRS